MLWRWYMTQCAVFCQLDNTLSQNTVVASSAMQSWSGGVILAVTCPEQFRMLYLWYQTLPFYVCRFGAFWRPLVGTSLSSFKIANMLNLNYLFSTPSKLFFAVLGLFLACNFDPWTRITCHIFELVKSCPGLLNAPPPFNFLNFLYQPPFARVPSSLSCASSIYSACFSVCPVVVVPASRRLIF